MLLESNCSICNDSRFVHPLIDDKPVYSQIQLCSCVKDKIIAERKNTLLKHCQLPPFTETMNFENFNVYKEVKAAYEGSKSMADNVGQLCWLGLLGDNGTGKTHLAVSVCKAWIQAGIPSRYTFVSLLLDELRRGFSNKNPEYNYETRFDYYCNIPLLLLDDYGVESATSWVQEKLDTIIDYRLMNNLSLIVTSNKSLDEMPPRIRSRLARHPKGKIIAILADDYSLYKRGR